MLVQKFKFAQTVTTKKLGLPGIGFIAGVMTPQVLGLIFYAKSKDEALKKFPKWTTAYPEWTEKPVYIVQFDELRKSQSFEEFLETSGITEHLKGKPIQMQCYEQCCEKTWVMYYPEDDLELFE